VALGCHYFAIFPVAIEALILLSRRGRSVLPALAAVGVAGAALLPLVISQLGGEHGDNVTAGAGLPERVKAAATSWLVGERGAAIANLEWLAGALLVAGVVVLFARGDPRAAILPAAVGGGAAALMALAALLGADYLNNRNTIGVLAIVLAVPALGFALNRAGGALGAAACAALAAATVGALIDPAHAREDWRAAARDLRGSPAVVVAPPYNEIALRWYAPDLRPAPTVQAADLAVLLTDPERDPLPPGALDTPPAPGFTAAGTTTRDRMLIARYRAPAPQPVSGEAVAAWARSRLDPARGAGGATLLARP